MWECIVLWCARRGSHTKATGACGWCKTFHWAWPYLWPRWPLVVLVSCVRFGISLRAKYFATSFWTGARWAKSFGNPFALYLGANEPPVAMFALVREGKSWKAKLDTSTTTAAADWRTHLSYQSGTISSNMATEEAPLLFTNTCHLTKNAVIFKFLGTV